MSFINIYISNPARITIDNSRLILDGDKKHIVYPLPDINSVMIESMQVNITSHALVKLGESNAVVFFCDEKHLPTAVFMPYNSHCRRLKMLRLQQDIKRPLQKQLWKNIIETKISNQARCLEFLGKNPQKLFDISARVLSGDSTNCEAEAAAYYFRALFDPQFTRTEEGNILNSALNYGYAVIRGLIARTIVSHGLEPNFGIFHASELNEFNLADDLIEVFRPVVDLCVAKYTDAAKVDLDTEEKMKLYNIVNYDVAVCGGRENLSNAVEKLVTSYITSLQNEEPCLKLPELIPLNIHEYE